MASISTGILEKFTTFGDLLRYLRRAAGLTQLELSVQVGYSHAQISRLEQNLRLPDIPTIEARFVPALGVADEPQVVARLLELAANVRREDAPGLGLCPYKGLNYFDESDADLFVGREALTSRLVERVLSLASSPDEMRFLAVVGASGSGKSSLMRAGVVPGLRWNRESADWQVYILTPTAHPLESLAANLTVDSTSVTATAILMDDLAREPRSLQLFVKRQLARESQTKTVLVIDQFEELFALCRAEEERAAFIDNLLAAVSEVQGPVIVLITLRADFYAHCANYVQLREALASNQEYIGAMSHEELRRAIEEPARRGRWELESGLVDLLLHDVGHEPGALPLLSHALYETWQRRRGRTLTLSGYASSGGVRGAIAETAEAVFTDQFSPEQQSIARRIFLRLTELGDEMSAADTRRRARFDELILKPEEAGSTHSVLKALADARLIITSEEAVEVAHEALIREWPTLRGWLEDNREGLRLHRQLTEAAHDWMALDRSPDLLYRGARLAQMHEWASAHQDEMNEMEREFLKASIELSEYETAEREAQHQRELESARKLAESEKQRAEEQTRSAQQLRRRAVHLTGAFVAALLLAAAALFLGRQAQMSSRLATSRELALASISSLDVDPERSILLALEALELHHTVEAEDALHRALQISRLQQFISAHEPGGAMMVTLSPDEKQIVTGARNETVRTWDTATGEQIFRLTGLYAAYSPDGKRMAVVLPNGTVKMIDPSTGTELPLEGQINAGLMISFSPDGSKLATVAANNTPKTWDSQTGRELMSFPGHSDYVSSVVFSPDGSRLLTASDDHTARVWDAATGEQIRVLSDHPDWVLGARYSPDGRRIATLSGNEVYVWDAESGARLLTLTGHNNLVFTVAFSPDGKRIATGAMDRKIILWDSSSGKELFKLSGHTGSIVELVFSPDGNKLYSSSDDGTVRLWNVGPARELLTIAVQASNGQAAFNADSTLVAITDGAGAVHIWDTRSGIEQISLPSPEQLSMDVSFDRAGTRIFIAGDNGQVRVLDTSTGVELAVIAGHMAGLNAIAISNDGSRLATASHDYEVKVWDIASAPISDKPLLTFEHSGQVFSVAFDASGGKLATGGQEGNITLWDTSTGSEIRVLRGHADLVSSVAFNLEGTRIATSSKDGTARVWDAANGEELFSMASHTGAVNSIAYSPDGTRIATVSEDGTAKIWNASNGEELLTFFGDGSPLYDIHFSPDGKLLATGSETGVRVYVLEMDDLIALAKTRLTRSLTAEECRKYLHQDAADCSPTTAVPTTTAIPPTDLGRVCQVTNTAGLYDGSFNEVLFEGLQKVNATYGWDVQVLQSASSSDFSKNIGEFLRGDCDLIVGLFPMADALRLAAETNPDQKFLIEYPYDPPLNNVWTIDYASDQAAFLAGYTAAAVTKTGKVGIYGGISIPQVIVFMDGFALGVEYYNQRNGTDVELLGWDTQTREGLFVGDFCCAAEGREITQQLLDQGADVILPAAGTDVGAGALYAVKSHGNAYLIGVDSDWAVINPEYSGIVLTSVIKHLDVSVVQVVQAIKNGRFTGGEHSANLESGEVGLAPFYELDALVPAGVKAELEQIKVDIISGKIETRPYRD